MKTKGILAIAAALVLAAPAIAAADWAGPNEVQVLEGHTVFTVIEAKKKVDEEDAEEAAAVAVLVREREEQVNEYKFPGVLWFNDQYLVPPGEVNEEVIVRHPCGGAVLAWNSADSQYVGPRSFNQSATDVDLLSDFPTGTIHHVTGQISSIDYEESYLVTDPNDKAWVVDKYFVNIPQGLGVITVPIWVVNILGYGTMTGDTMQTIKDNYPAWTADTGGDCDPYDDDPPAGYYEPTEVGATDPIHTFPDSYCYEGNVDTTGNTAGSGCEDAISGVRPAEHAFREYNALLFFYFGTEDVYPTGVKAHEMDDTNGCWPDTEWDCPNDDSTKQGNSHPFNPRSVPTADRACSDGTEPDSTTNRCPVGEHASHATGDVDVWFSPDWRPTEPAARNFVLEDGVGQDEKFYGLRQV